MKRLSILFVCIIVLVSLAACKMDAYKDYQVTNMRAREFTQYEDLTFKTNTVELITDYEKYSSYHLSLDYNEEFFKNNNLLVFNVASCSSDQMEYVELRDKDGTLFPLFERKKIGENDPVTDDYILRFYCVELSKELEYKAGKIIYNYK